MKGTWEDDGYPASSIVFKEDKTGTVEYQSWGSPYYFKFTWNNATEASLADEGSFIEIDEEGNEVDSSTFVLTTFKLMDSQVVLQFEFEDPITFTKTVQIVNLDGGTIY